MTGVQSSPKRAARIAGAAYLVTVIAGLFAEIGVRGKLIDYGNAAATAHNVVAAETLYRLGFAADIVGGVGYLVVTVVLYELLKPVNRTLSLLAGAFSAIGISVGAVAALAHLAPLLLLKDAYMAPFTTAQLQAAALLALKLHARAYWIALVFFGCYEALLGYLIAKSTFFPRALGVLVALAGCAFIVNSFALFILPPVGNVLNPYLLALDGIGEIALTLWLLIRGVNAQKWAETARALRN